MNLNVSKKTFNKYLLDMELNLKIKQYEDFIKRIKREIRKELDKSIKEEKFKEKVNEIFIKTPSLFILIADELITNIRKTYFKKILNEGILDIYIEDKGFYFNKEIMILAYKKFLLKEIKDSNEIQNKFKYIYNKNNLSYYKIEKCYKKEEFNLNNEEKDEIRKEVEEEIKKIYKRFIMLSKIYQIKDEEEIDNFLFEDYNDYLNVEPRDILIFEENIEDNAIESLKELIVDLFGKDITFLLFQEEEKLKKILYEDINNTKDIFIKSKIEILRKHKKEIKKAKEIIRERIFTFYMPNGIKKTMKVNI